MMWKEMDARFDAYLRDESRCSGQCESICFPENPEQLHQALLSCVADGSTVTIQGARTGITGGCTPAGGRLISTEKLDYCQIEGETLLAQCGARLKDIQNTAKSAGLSFPPNPTEDTATIGGALACAACAGEMYPAT